MPACAVAVKESGPHLRLRHLEGQPTIMAIDGRALGMVHGNFWSPIYQAPRFNSPLEMLGHLQFLGGRWYKMKVFLVLKDNRDRNIFCF